MFGSITYPRQWTLLILHLAIPSALFRFLASLFPKSEKSPIAAPGAVPIFGHLDALIFSPTKLASIFAASPKHGNVLRLKLPFTELWIVNQASQILPTLSTPKIYDFEPMKSMALRNIVGLSGAALTAIDEDNSGVSTKPLPDSNIHPDNRFNYLERKMTQDFTRPSSHAALVQKFSQNLHQWVEECNIGEEWVTPPDLHIFVRDILFKATTDAFFGPHLLRLSPDLVEDIWKFDQDVPFLAKGLPAFLKPKAYRARARCIEAFRKWRSFALKNGPQSDTLPEWNDIFGLKCMKLRNELFEKTRGWKYDEGACAASDLAVLFGLTSNAIRASFWFLLETLQSNELFDDASKEVTSVATSSGSSLHIDERNLLRLPLLQSIYAETLRKYVSVMMVRKTRQASRLGGYTVPIGKKVVICNYSEHMNEALWQPETGNDLHPVGQFWGRRFLSYSKDAPNTPTFATENLGRKWMPFGVGERMCPGRHFTKHQMLLTFALLSSNFDIELTVSTGNKAEPDMTHFGYGTMGPDRPMPFRIRRKFARQTHKDSAAWL
ncbi:cytochrome P450 [Lophiotrema nucula]|uniref:Cytochrome P450 n=1 Tax=Lophiotrema nucula TaxID=690887 RepID=A0A6A5Z8A6_9PLEO|nr:cytochrome P450 [Lophiotrema nucula]